MDNIDSGHHEKHARYQKSKFPQERKVRYVSFFLDGSPKVKSFSKQRLYVAGFCARNFCHAATTLMRKTGLNLFAD
ncbi:MAG: hypothetical protein ACREA9_02025 [Pyrinomonadaceae bacterium]